MNAGLSPLDTILRRLQPVPSLGALLSYFEEPELMAYFLDMIDEYLPEWRAEIMSNEYIGDRIGIFIREFSSRHFDIHGEWVQSIFSGDYGDGDEEGETSLLEGLVHYIPLEVEGFTEDDYHGFQYKTAGFQLMLSLVRCPYEVPEDFSCHGMIPKNSGGLRVPLLEEMKKLVGEDLARRIPEAGWEREHIHALVDGTKYAGLGDFADWVEHETGCTILDLSEDDYNMDPWDWDRETVDRLSRERRIAGEKQARSDELGKWLEQNPRENFGKMLKYMLGKKLPPKEEPRPRTLAEIYGVNDGKDEAAATLTAGL